MMSDQEGSARNTFRSACKMVSGLWEMASEVLCHFPGQCWMVNLYLRVFSFNLNNWGFRILLRSLSLSNPFSGSWSVTTIRFGQPITNLQHFSSAHAIAAASPLRGVYLHSASMQNLLLANIRCLPSGQQTGALSMVYKQYFCSSRKPIPSLLSSECLNASLRLFIPYKVWVLFDEIAKGESDGA